MYNIANILLKCISIIIQHVLVFILIHVHIYICMYMYMHEYFSYVHKPVNDNC